MTIIDELRRLSLFVVLVFLLSSLSLAQVSRNISTASRFNQNFKDEVDLKMYYFVTGGDDQLPWGEVETAETLATIMGWNFTVGLQNTSASFRTIGKTPGVVPVMAAYSPA